MIHRKLHTFIINAIDGEAYDAVSKTENEKIDFLFETFYAEYGWRAEQIGEQPAMAEWFSGLPSVIDVPFYNEDIAQLLSDNHVIAEANTDHPTVGSFFGFLATCAITLKEDWSEVQA